VRPTGAPLGSIRASQSCCRRRLDHIGTVEKKKPRRVSRRGQGVLKRTGGKGERGSLQLSCLVDNARTAIKVPSARDCSAEAPRRRDVRRRRAVCLVTRFLDDAHDARRARRTTTHDAHPTRRLASPTGNLFPSAGGRRQRAVEPIAGQGLERELERRPTGAH
jgi:hypothetical protein